MKKTMLGAIVGFVWGYGAFLAGQSPQATNLAGAPFPMMQWTPTRITGQKQTGDMTSKNFYFGDVEIRTPGIIVHADEAVHDVISGRIELRGGVTATLVRQNPIWPTAK